MPFLEMLGGSFLQFFADGLSRRATEKREAVAAGREAMRQLAASLSYVISDLEAGIHRLRKVRHDPPAFGTELSSLLDNERLRMSCHTAGVCAGLRNAQDALEDAKGAFEDADLARVKEVILEIDGYEGVFVRHVREFLATARELDLEHSPVAAPDAVLPALEDRVQRLRALADAVEKVAEGLRENPRP